MEPALVLALIFGGLIALTIGLSLLAALIVGSVFLFDFASEQGFVGIAAYVACWVFMFPAMPIACAITGAIIIWRERVLR